MTETGTANHPGTSIPLKRPRLLLLRNGENPTADALYDAHQVFVQLAGASSTPATPFRSNRLASNSVSLSNETLESAE